MTTPRFKKLPGAGQRHAFTFSVEVGPITYVNSTKAEAAAKHRALRDAVDRYARTLLDVGPYSNAVTTTDKKVS